MLRHLERLERPAKQGTASCPPDDAVEGGQAPAGKGPNGRRAARMVCPTPVDRPPTFGFSLLRPSVAILAATLITSCRSNRGQTWNPVALRLFVSTRSLAASFVRPWTVRTDRTRATDLSGKKVTKQDSPGPQRGESRRRLPWARVTNIRGPRRSQYSSCHSKRWQASCAACT